MIAVSCDGISLEFGVESILDNITFSINERDRLGIVGVNGAGKSTLLKIITGMTQPTSGNVYIARDKTVMMLSQNVEFVANCTIEEAMLECYSNLISEEQRLEQLQKEMDSGRVELASAYTAALEEFTAKGGFEFRSRCRGILISLGFSPDMLSFPVMKLSGGQRTRLALARILYMMPDIMILDEPTNHLDMATLRWLEDYLANYKKTIIVVSHDRYFLDRVTNKILDIENKKAKLYSGNYTTFAEKKKKDRDVLLHHYKNQQREIAKIEAFIEQQRRWNREKNIIAAESRMKALDRMEKIDRPENSPEDIRLSFPECPESGNDVLRLSHLSKSYGEKTLFEDLNLLVKKNQRMVIIGDNGCGKSTLLKILTGSVLSDSGSFEFGYNLHIGYYDQENQNLISTNTVLDELWDEFPTLTHTKVRNTLALFNFTGDDVGKKVENLSGGERARLTLAKLTLSKSNLLILDEVTNHLDIGTREVLEDALLGYNGTIIAVSHDRYFISKLANRILDFSSPVGMYDYEGGYNDYLEFAKRLASDDNTTVKPQQTQSANKGEYLKNKQANADLRKAKRRVAQCQKEIEALEQRLDEIENEIGDNSSDHVKLTALFEEKEASEEKLLSLYEEFEETSYLLQE